jgi:hypothetical protein
MSCAIFAEDREVRSFSLSVLDAEQFEDIRGVIRIRKSKKYIHHNG